MVRITRCLGKNWLWFFLVVGLFLLAAVEASSAVPNVLNRSDQAIYKKAFAAVRAKQFATAKQLIKTADDPILRPAVLAQIYIHPNYKSNIGELSVWLKKYYEQGMARNIYRLALIKRPNKKYPLTKPEVPTLPLDAMESEARKKFLAKQTKNGKMDAGEFAISQLERRVYRLRRLVKRKRLTQALALTRQNVTAENKKNNPKLLDRMFAITISGFYFAQRYQQASNLADEASLILKDKAIESSWWGGLAEWQRSRYNKAQKYFLVTSKSVDPFLQSAAFFWQGRALASMHKDDLALQAVANATKNPTTFYGQIGLKYMEPRGKKITEFDIFRANPRPNRRVLARLSQIAVMARGFALLNVDEPELAMLEWQFILNKLKKSYSENLLAVTDDYQLHHTGMRLALHLKRISGRHYGYALFPIVSGGDKDLKPDDAALALGVARQESHFFPYAISRSGAIGMMQMMPTTATMVSRWDDFKDLTQFYNNNKWPSRYDLYNPELNFIMGTRYLASLLRLNDFNGNLIFAVAAYNGGPNNVRKWVKKKKIYGNDPLLFIESIPLRETRLYVSRVLANYWVYNHILDLNHSTLTDIANNRWPKKFVGE
ncbi:MAG: lytic transglycosylase domain-containing protein [Alphaproteobacteria bacterium]